LADEVRAARAAVLQAAYAAHPERFVRTMPVPPALPEAAWINKPILVASSDEARH
jgi:putative transposase